MEKTSTILNEPTNYIPLVVFSVWTFVNSFEYSTPIIDNPLPFILILFCAALYKVKIGFGKLAVGLMLLAYTFNMFQISESTMTFQHVSRINDVTILNTGQIKFTGLVFCLIYFACYARQIGRYVRYGIRFMINPEEK